MCGNGCVCVCLCVLECHFRAHFSSVSLYPFFPLSLSLSVFSAFYQTQQSSSTAAWLALLLQTKLTIKYGGHLIKKEEEERRTTTPSSYLVYRKKFLNHLFVCRFHQTAYVSSKNLSARSFSQRHSISSKLALNCALDTKLK